MPEIARLSGHREWIDSDFVERERTPEPAMALGIQSHLAGLSLSNAVELLATLGVQRSRKAIHDWVRKADLQPDAGQSPNHVALDETGFGPMISNTGCMPPLIRRRITCFTCDCSRQPRQHSPRCSSRNSARNTTSKLPCFSSMAPSISKLHSAEQGSDFKCVATEIGTLSNGSSANSNAEPRRSRTVSVTSTQKPPNHGSKPSLTGTILLTKHDVRHGARSGQPTSSFDSRSASPSSSPSLR